MRRFLLAINRKQRRVEIARQNLDEIMRKISPYIRRTSEEEADSHRDWKIGDIEGVSISGGTRRAAEGKQTE